MNLRIPGPTPCPDDVLQALSRPMVDHRGPEFAAVIKNVNERIRPFFQTEGDILILTSAGTGGLEAAIVNHLSPGDKVLAVSIGVFGDRFAKIAETYGANVTRLRFPDGTAADPAKVAEALAADPGIYAVTVTHNETSTGVTNDLESLAKVIKGAGKLLLVDAVSSLGSINLPIDAWGCDVVVSGSQKGWMVPPGLSFVAVNERGWEANAKAKMPRFYFDLAEAKKSNAKAQTPWTPGMSVYFGLEVALDRMQKEGREAIFARHQKLGAMTRAGVKALGLKPLVADEKYASNTVTAVVGPEGIEIKALRTALRAEGVHVAGGQGALDGKIFRIGHLGYCSEEDIAGCLTALRAALTKLGVAVPAAQ